VRVDWAVIARYSEVNNGLATIIGAGIDTFGVAAIPSPLLINLTIRLAGMADADQHQMSVQVLDPDLAELGRLTAPFTVAGNPLAPPGWESAVVMPVQIQVTVSRAGSHAIHIECDGSSRTLAFRVFEATEVPGPLRPSP
jgi:hypothetical protein